MGKFTKNETSIDGVYVIEPTVFGDNRGYFMETYKKDLFEQAGLDYVFVQENQARSTKGVLRGLHYQKQFSQAKLVRCTEGIIFDVCVDLRPKSPTYGKWFGAYLTAEEGNMLMIPRGFAHGVLIVSDYATFTYKCDNVYHPEDEYGLMWNDPLIGIDWPKLNCDIILSNKDKNWPSFKKK